MKKVGGLSIQRPAAPLLQNSYGDLTVTCSHPDGEKGAISVQSSTAGAAFDNIIAGGIIGAAVDMSSGAAYIYPSNVAVPLASPAPVASTSAQPYAAIRGGSNAQRAAKLFRGIAVQIRKLMLTTGWAPRLPRRAIKYFSRDERHCRMRPRSFLDRFANSCPIRYGDSQ
jgi:hypothetical protein